MSHRKNNFDKSSQPEKKPFNTKLTLIVLATILLITSTGLLSVRMNYESKISKVNSDITALENDIGKIQNLVNQEQRYQGIIHNNRISSVTLLTKYQDILVFHDTLTVLKANPKVLKQIQIIANELYLEGLGSVYMAAKSKYPSEEEIKAWSEVSNIKDLSPIFKDYKAQFEKNYNAKTRLLNDYQHEIKEDHELIAIKRSEMVHMQNIGMWLTIVASIFNVLSIILGSWAGYIDHKKPTPQGL